MAALALGEHLVGKLASFPRRPAFLTRAGAPQTLKAWSVAQTIAQRLASRREVLGVAVVGSLARGDFAPGSDVDLWVLAHRNARVDGEVDGLTASQLWADARQASRPEMLLRFEVEPAVVLHDPKGLFLALKEAWAARGPALRQRAVEGSELILRELVQRARAARPPLALAALREVARRGAAIRLFLDRGWRVPRLRHFERALAPDAFQRLARVLEVPAEVGASCALLEQARRGRPPVPALPLPEVAQVTRYLAAGRLADAVLSIRQGLPPGPRGGRALNRPQQRLFDLVHGFDSAPPSSREVAAAARQTFYLLDQLDLLRGADAVAGLEEALRPLTLYPERSNR